MTNLCGVYVVEMFYDGALSALLRIAQRHVAAHPHAGQEQSAFRLFHEGMALVVCIFAHAVPQARPSPLSAPPSRRSSLLAMALLLLKCLSFCRPPRLNMRWRKE